VELYETALHLDGSVDGAFAALKRLHHSEGRWRDLIGVLEREAEQTRDPDLRAMAHYRVSRIYSERLGARDKAILALERSVAENPRYRLVLEELISLYEAAGRHEAQVQTYERLIELIEQPRERISLLYHVGELYEEELKDEESAIEFYEAALEIEPTYRPALKSLAKLYRRRQSWDELIRINLREAEASSDVIRQAAAHARVAELLEVHKKDIRGAIDHHSRALSLDANIEASFKSLARLFTREKRYHELIELLERGVDATGDADRKIAYLFRIGDIFSHELSEPIQAAHTYRRILKLDPNHLGAMHALQRATETSGRYKELVEALELESRNTFEKDRIVALLHRAGEVLDTHLDDRDGALARYRKVLELNPKYEPALASVGKLYHRAGRWEDLLATYERELQLKETPTASVALLYTMGKLCEQKLARDTQAIACYRKAVGIDPRHGPTLHALGRKLRARGAWSELVEVLELELKSTTDKRARALAAYRIGRVHEEHLKANDLAQQAYLQALESLPDYRPALDGLARVRASERRWTQVVDDLAREAKSSSEQKIALAALLRAGEIWSEQLDQPDRAIACYEEVLRRDERNLAALMALEPLYRRKGAWNALVDVYLREAATFSDTAAVVAALREVARLYETKPLGDPAGLRRAYIEILKRSPDDPQALMAVEQMALGQRDDQMLAAVDRQLSAGDEDPALLGAYHTRLGETLEREGDAREALKAFEAALEHDPESVAAMHGLIRTATAVDEPRALVSAKKRLADFERDGEVAASLLVETARIRLTRLDDSDRAIADLERALERWPDSLEAARELYRILLTVGNATRLLDRLSTAAEAARDNERAGALWRMVAELQADELGNIAGGIAILRRVQRTLPSNVEIMMLLANLLTRNEQWNDAAHAFEQVIKMSSDVDILCDANSTLAVILSDNLQSFDRARQCLEAVLLLRPEDRTTLRMLTDVETKRGDFAAAAETARRLLRASSSLEERIDSIIHLAEIQMDAGQRAEAFEVLLSAVELEGPQGMAAREYKRHHTDNDSWEPYEAALMKRLQRGDGRGGDVTETFLELARVQDVNLGRPERAISTLEMALHDRPEDDALWVDYAARLRAAGKLEKSIRAYRRLVERSPARGEAWRGIVKGFVDLKMPGEAALAIAPLSALGEASEADARAFAKFAPRPAAAQPGSITPDRMRSHVDRNHLADVAEDFVRVMDTSLAKLYPVELQNYGLTTREKLTARSGNPVRAVSDRIAQIFGLPEHDFYVYRGAGTVVTVDFGAVPTLLVPATVLKLTETQQIFALARAHAAAVRGLTALHRFKPQDLKLILAAAARAGAPNFGDNLADAAALDDLQRRIYRALARKDRKAFEEQAARYAASPALDFVSWLKEHKISAIRVAALVASDLPSCVALLRQEDQSLMYLEGADLVANSDLIADLLRYWFSEPALELRRGAGMLGAPAAT
ncbi:MAG: tetratricopeptide repeat protein, partial [Myxococcales bacterium]|nr:tetratricopeptide repeat protein [Myxococcales bacterium]